MLARGETDFLGGVVEGKGEEFGIRAEGCFGGEEGATPLFWVEEDGFWGGILDSILLGNAFTRGQELLGDGVEGADVVVWHHCFGVFTVCFFFFFCIVSLSRSWWDSSFPQERKRKRERGREERLTNRHKLLCNILSRRTNN